MTSHSKKVKYRLLINKTDDWVLKHVRDISSYTAKTMTNVTYIECMLSDYCVVDFQGGKVVCQNSEMGAMCTFWMCTM